MGCSWPATERLTYSVGESVRWRILNLSTQLHPMHLHGFYFEVDALGDGSQETSFADGEKRPRVVTQLMAPGHTLNMRWTPEKVGNWLFHCHRMLHVSLDSSDRRPRAVAGAPTRRPRSIRRHVGNGARHQRTRTRRTVNGRGSCGGAIIPQADAHAAAPRRTATATHRRTDSISAKATLPSQRAPYRCLGRRLCCAAANPSRSPSSID